MQIKISQPRKRVEEEAGNVYVLSLGYFFDHVFCWCSFAEPCDYSLIAEMIKLYWLKKEFTKLESNLFFFFSSLQYSCESQQRRTFQNHCSEIFCSFFFFPFFFGRQ